MRIHHLRRLGDDNIFARVLEVRRCLAEMDHIDRLSSYHSQYEGSYCVNLVHNVRRLQGIGINSQDIFCKITHKPLHEHTHEDLGKIRAEFQKEVVKAIKTKQAPDAIQRLRHKLERWRNILYGIPGPPGIYCRQIHRRLHELAKIVPPRVHSAVLHTLFNGWVTHRRLQRRGKTTNQCVFRCCDSAEDSIEHYCKCEVVLRVATHTFRINYSLDQALNIWSLRSDFLDNTQNMLSLSLLIYGVYNAFNTLRHNPVVDDRQAFHCIVQHCRQGAFGHGGCMSHLDSRWQQAMKYTC